MHFYLYIGLNWILFFIFTRLLSKQWYQSTENTVK